MLEFILERYNYWIFITLMMIGLYIVISRGNLVKTIIGLNLFQTSVFIFYISIGKVAGGTAPILVGGHGDGGGHGEEGAHGDGHGDGHEAGYGEEAGHGNTLDADTGAGHEEAAHGGDSLHGAEGTDSSNTLDTVLPGGEAHAGGDEALHQLPDALQSTGAENSIAQAAAHGAEVVYTNPLPHVLILTAIVVGVATTAVGLALAVRIREAYGSIEEDELEAEDHFAEFGVPLERSGAQAAQGQGGSA